MPPTSVLLPVAAIVLLSLIVAGRIGPLAAAQHGTPPAGGFEIAPGVVAAPLPVPENPPALYRLRFAPGVTYPFAGDPTLGVVHVESGALALRVDAAVTVGRLAASEAAGKNVPAGTEFAVAAGDYFVLAPFAAGEVRNDGPDEASVAVAGFVPEGMATPAAATPAA